MREYKCEYAEERDDEGYCERKRHMCNGCGDVYRWPGEKDKFHIVKREDICKVSSLWGNYYFTVTAQDVANLIAGQCLALTGAECNVFLSYDGGPPNEIHN